MEAKYVAFRQRKATGGYAEMWQDLSSHGAPIDIIGTGDHVGVKLAIARAYYGERIKQPFPFLAEVVETAERASYFIIINVPNKLYAVSDLDLLPEESNPILVKPKGYQLELIMRLKPEVR